MTPIPTTTRQAEFIRAMRHELRTPVNHIIGYSEMLLEEASDGSALVLTSGLQQIQAAGRLLLGLINESLSPASVALFGNDLTRLRRQVGAPLSQILNDCATLETASITSGLSAIIPDLQKIATAAQHLRELLNASAPPPNDLPIAAHLPTSVIEGDGPAVGSGRLLVVDDNAMNRDMLTRRLERIGYTVTAAETGRQALDLLATAPFDLVLLDIMMPEMNGYQVLQTLKASPVLRHIPVVMLSAADEHESVVRCVQMGAEDYLPKPFDPVLLRARLNASLRKKHLHDLEMIYLAQIKKEKKRADDLLDVVIPIGVALTAEKDFDRLLETIVVEAQALCNADGGTLYLRSDDDMLRWVIVRNRSLGIALGGTTGQPISFAPLPMYDPQTGAPNHHYVVTHAALTGSTISIADAYTAAGFDFSGTRAFDQQTGYHSRSFVNLPLRDGGGRVIGVLQLLNAQDPESGVVLPFDAGQQQMLESLSALAAVAVGGYAREQRLRQQIEALRIEIDDARKARQVAEITETDYFQQLQAKARKMRSGRS